MSLWKHSIKELSEQLHQGSISATELLDDTWKRIDAVEPRVHGFLSLLRDFADAAAKRADESLKKKTGSYLTGIPLAIKDVICVKDYPTTCASKILENFKPPYHATVVERLSEAGAVLVGKTNMDEFAMGSSTENSAFGVTRNPWDTSRVPGGSSGGSAAVVAAGEVPGALGTDTGGSIRQPASLCGVPGFKPTYGMVSRYGLVAFASSLDQIGPFARSVYDCAKIYETIAGHDPKDSTSAKMTVRDLPDYQDLDKIDEGLIKGLVIGLPQEFLGEGLDPEVKAGVLKTAKIMEGLGAKIEEVRFPSLDYAVSAYYVIASAEASSNLARYDGTRYGLRVSGKTTKAMSAATRKAGFGREVKRRIMLGTYALSAGYYDAFYLKAQKIRTLIRNDFLEAFKKCRLLLTPTAPSHAFKIGEKSSDPLAMYLSDIYTIPANLVGIPGLSVPVAFSKEKLPIGAQLLGPAFSDWFILKVGSMLEKHLQLPFQAPVETC